MHGYAAKINTSKREHYTDWANNRHQVTLGRVLLVPTNIRDFVNTCISTTKCYSDSSTMKILYMHLYI